MKTYPTLALNPFSSGEEPGKDYETRTKLIGGSIAVKFMLILMIQALLSFALVKEGMTVDPSQGGPEQIVKGDVLLKEGEFYIIKDITGHEVRVHVSSDTKMDGPLKTGDKIEAKLTSDGHAISIRLPVPGENPPAAMSPSLPQPTQ